MPLIDAHEIFSQYHRYFLTGSHFAQNHKMALLSLSLNLEAQYHTQSWTKSGATYSQGIIDMVSVEKNIQMFLKFLQKFYTLCHVWHLCMLLLARLLITQTLYFVDILHCTPD